jgi:hypothetical protein
MAAEVEVQVALFLMAVKAAQAVEVMLQTPELLELLTLVVVAEAVQAHHQTQAQAVQALSSFHTQTYMRRQQLQQVHQL